MFANDPVLNGAIPSLFDDIGVIPALLVYIKK